MSSYRNYYSTRSDAQEPRFSSITPSTYRPSFSGGTYRIKRDPISTTPSYVSRYTTSTATSKDSIKDKLSESAKTTTSKTLPTPSSSSSSSVLSKSQPSSTQRTYGSSTTIARDNTCNHGKPRYTATASTPSASVSKYGLRSRDPSPATDRRSTNNLTTSRIKSRDPSPSPSTIRGKSRDPSPAVDIKPKVGSYSSAYRLGSRTSSSGYSSHYGSNASLSRNALTDKSISYLSCSDFSARTVSRAREIAERKSNENELKDEKSSSTSVSSKSKSSSQSKPQNEVTANKDSEESQFIAIEVVTRGTSPTPPGTTTVTRTRRIDLAKTIEKTIQRSKIKPQMDDKEIQSDRLDDPTRYSRFGLSSRMSSYSPHSDRYSSSLRYTNSPLSNKSSRDTTSRSESESKKDDSTSKSSINKSSNLNTYSSTKVDRSKNSPETKTKISPPKTTIQMTIPKQKSPESTTTNSVGRSLPPVIPKGESPTKTISSTSTSNIAKLPNKDFRKSALNVGPTDRPRKSRTPSVGTDTEDKAEMKSPTVNGTIQLLQRLERSPSIGSETGSSSSSSSTVSSSHSSATNKNIKSRLTSTTSKPKLKAQNTNIDEQSLISRDTSTNSNATASTTGGSATGSYKKMETTATTTTTSAYSELDDSFINNARRIVTGMSAETQMNQQPLAAMNSRNTSITNVSAIAAISTNTITATPNLTTAQTTTTTTTASTSSPQPYKYHQINNSPATDSSASTFAKNTNDTDAKTFLIRKLESVSNFFAARQHDTNSEPMFLDTTSSSSQNISLSSDGRKQEDNSASVLYTELTVEHPQTTTITTTASNPNTDTTSDPIDDSSWWLDTSRQINTESALDIKDEMKYRIRHIDSGEAAWWIRNDEDDTLAEDLKTLNQEDPSEINDCSLLQNSGDSGNLEENSCWWGGNDVTISGDSNTQLVEQVAKVEKAKSEEPPWWLNDDDDYENSQTDHNLKNTQNNCNDNSWWDTENSNMENNSNNAVVVSKSDSSNRLEKAKVSTRFEECGEKALWQDETNNVEQTQTKAKIELSNSDNSVTNNLSKTPSSDKPWWMSGPSKKLFNIRHVESGEKAWWMQDNNEDESVCQSPENDKNLEATKKSDNDSDNNDDCNGDGGHKEEIEDEEIKNIHNNIYPNINEISLNNSTPPLGDRASPEGLEDPVKNRKSPYDNIPSTNNSRTESSQKLFISRHTNIDEILGGSCRPLRSPIMDRLEGKNIFIEEITPEQVRIHDSRAQNAVIQRIERDEWDYHISPQRNDHTKIALDDAALQVYKDGDYGAYLDLESSLAEQSEEIEGLHSSRKNSLVVRTQLSVRVHAIIEKLLSSEGSELRRALFSLKQIFQEDKDLVHGFVALGGLNCLVRVGNGADQNYQNYILRALGQVMLYVDGMNGVMKHGPTVQWLYSLIASKYRLVVKTALKLLLVFVEYVESNCYLLVNAIHVVDIAQGNVPWTNIMKLLKDYENADTELLIYATSLINKTLSGLSDQDSFYDESDLLEQQGMEGVIQRYMSRPGTDLDLLDQLQLYEAVLKFEDGEADSIRVPHNSVRQTLRYSSSKADSTERRKSRRHSTGTSPAGNKTLSPPKRLIPKTPGGPLDEDSSSSSNSNEFSSGVFKDKGHREEAGVTPALRRRRERAERHKSFMREQQEATANNGIMAAFEKREELGQIVTAVPVQLKNGNDTPPDSLISSNEISPPPSTPQSPLLSSQLALASSPITDVNMNPNANSNGNVLNNNGDIIKTPFSPTKCLLGSTTISVISNGFDRKLTNGNANFQNGSTEFRANKNMMIKSNATVINGLIKNINRNDNENLSSPLHHHHHNHHNHNHNNHINNNNNHHFNNNNNNNNNNNSQYNSHKKFESNTNRLNNYYTQLSAPKAHGGMLCQKNLNNFDSNNVSNKNRSTNHLNGTQINQKEQPSGVSQSVVNPMTIIPELNSTTNSNNSQGFITCPSATNESPLLQQPPSLSSDFDTIKVESDIENASPNGRDEVGVCGVDIDCDDENGCVGGGGGGSGSGVSNGNSGDVVQAIKRIDSEQFENNKVSSVASTDIQVEESDNEDRKLLLQLKKDHTVKDLTQKLSNLPTSPTHEEKPQNRIGDMTMTGLISKAKEGLAKSKSKGEISRSPSVDQEIKKAEPKKSENELHWDELVKSIARPLTLCDLDFTDLHSDDEKDVLAPRGLGGGVPPPPPPLGMQMGMPLMMGGSPCPPPPSNLVPPLFNYNNSGLTTNDTDSNNPSKIKKNKKTVKLFWKEVREDMIPVTVGKTIWDELPDANVDIQKLEHLFESRAKDLMTKKQQEMNKNKEIIVLDHKRSNAINIAITKLPPPRAIKAAILKMDATVVTREGIDKLLNMLPTEEERGKIQEAQMSNPELPLGSAEQFLLTLASISELSARLKLWAFKLDFENSEKEIAEPLMDLKQGIELLRQNRTFKCILSTLLSVGIFLNGAPVKGFQIEYLAKVPEVKDTVHKHSLLHHLCHMVMESSSDTTDLYSEIGPITRSSKADFTELAHNLVQLETECKASWDRLKLIAKHDCPPQMKQKLVDFLADCAERIILLQIVHRRVINRYRKFLLWLGIPQHSVAESRPNEFCRIVSEFALEYRTTRERVQQQIEKKANHRERNKTRGKMIIDVTKFRTQEDRADAALKELLGSPNPDSVNGTLTWRRRRAENLRSPIIKQNEENFTDGDDEILESLVKTATKAPGARPTPRERKRTRHADRKSLRRTLKNGLTEEEKQHVSSLIKSY